MDQISTKICINSFIGGSEANLKMWVLSESLILIFHQTEMIHCYFFETTYSSDQTLPLKRKR